MKVNMMVQNEGEYDGSEINYLVVVGGCFGRVQG